MTREESIDLLDNLIGMIEDNHNSDYDKALKMAIEALKKENCEDVISRQATVQRLCKIADFMNEKRDGLGSPYVMAALFIQDNKDEFPCVTPQEPKTGHWVRWYETIEHDNCTEHYPHCKCSECGQEYDSYIVSSFKYCPNCGAKMEEVKNDIS